MRNQPIKINGVINFNLGWRGLWQNVTVVGGPYDHSFKSPSTFNVLARIERTNQAFDTQLPIIDFSVPEPEEYGIVVQVVNETIDNARRGKLIWIGCMGGMGRTGLVLAIIAKATGYNDPVQYVRDNYYEHAVETERQKEYVENFDINPIRKHILTSTLKRDFLR